MTQLTITNNSALRRLPTQLISLLLLGLVLAGWESQPRITGAQTSTNVRFTQALKLQEIEPGIEYGQTASGQTTKDETTGPWFINVVRVDLRKAKIKLARALDEGVGVETVSSLAMRHRAPAAINGGYFRTTGTFRGESIGLFILDQKLISEPNNERAAFGLVEVGDTTEIFLGHIKFSGEISSGSAKRTVQGLNRPLTSDDLIVFTPEFHRTTLTAPDGVEVVIRGNKVISVIDQKGSSKIPSDGYVISAVGQSRQWVLRHVLKGSRVTFSWRLSPIDVDENSHRRRAYSIVGGGPQLIKGGKIAITDQQEKMASGFASALHPRTAIAKLDSGKLLLVTVDGRQPGVSVGMSLHMLAELLLEFGAVEAINLDGGGSTTMVINNKVVNRPSDQTGERPVSDAILVFPKGN